MEGPIVNVAIELRKTNDGRYQARRLDGMPMTPEDEAQARRMVAEIKPVDVIDGTVRAVLIDSTVIGAPVWFAFDDGFTSGDDIPVFFASELQFLRQMTEAELRRRYEDKRATRRRMDTRQNRRTNKTLTLRQRRNPMEKEMTVKQIGDVLGKHTRDLVNENQGLQNRIAYFEQLRDAVQEAVKIAGDTGATRDKLGADVQRLTLQKTDLERGIRSLNESMTADKDRARVAREAAEQAEQCLAGLQDQIDAANAHIARGVEAQRVLASLSSH